MTMCHAPSGRPASHWLDLPHCPHQPSAGSAAADNGADSAVSTSDMRAKAVGVLFQLVGAAQAQSMLFVHPDFVDFSEQFAGIVSRHCWRRDSLIIVLAACWRFAPLCISIQIHLWSGHGW